MLIRIQKGFFFSPVRTLKALSGYVARGFLELIHMPLSGDQPNGEYSQKLYFKTNFDSHIRHEKVAHHDCFYRNMYDFEFISPIGENGDTFYRYTTICGRAKLLIRRKLRRYMRIS